MKGESTRSRRKGNFVSITDGGKLAGKKGGDVTLGRTLLECRPRPARMKTRCGKGLVSRSKHATPRRDEGGQVRVKTTGPRSTTTRPLPLARHPRLGSSKNRCDRGKTRGKSGKRRFQLGGGKVEKSDGGNKKRGELAARPGKRETRCRKSTQKVKEVTVRHDRSRGGVKPGE